ncbi:MAG: polysaccharide biosynthesis/export family protein [Syntrophaceae bacterium]
MKKMLVLMLMLLFVLPFSSYGQDKSKETKKSDSSQIAVDSDQYIIGPEDVLYIHIWKEEAMTKTVPVRMDGNISLPLLDDVRAEGLTPLQLKEVLIKKLKEKIENPSVSVTVMEANSFKVFVIGEVKNPGVVRLRSKTTFLQLLTMVGGLNEWANQKKIMVIRKEKDADKRFYINYKKVINGDEADIELLRGDRIVVP